MAKNKTTTQPEPDATLTTGNVIEIPELLDLPMGYLPRVVKVHLDRPQRETLKRLTETLQYHETTLADGKPIVRPVDAIRWLLEQIDPR